jgi:hypothetical protein
MSQLDHVSAERVPVPSGLTRYVPALDREVDRFQREVFPHRRADWVWPRWRWMFLESAARLSIPPMVWLYRSAKANGVVAHQGAIPVRVKIGGDERLSGWFVETAVLESHRGKAIGPMVVAKAREDLPFNLSLGQTPEMRAIQFGLGWTQICALDSFVFVLRAAAVVQGRFRGRLLRPAAAAALSLAQRAKYSWGRRRRAAQLEVREIERFDNSHTALWHRVGRHFPCAAVRDASYLNWKYADQPGQHFIRLALRRRGTVVGVLVLSIREPGDGRRFRRGIIVDLILPPSDADVVWGALEAARRRLDERGVDLMTIDLTNAALARHVRSFGFMATTPERVFLVSAGGLTAEQRALVQSPASWLLTGGDSDIDRPW